MKVHPNRMKWIVKRLSLIVGALALVLVVVAAIQYRKKAVVGEDALLIEIVKNKEGNKFISTADVEQIIFREFKHSIIGKPLEVIDIEAIEKVLEEDIFIKNAEIYIDALNKVHIKIEQRVPIVRIMDIEDPSYYLDADGNRVRTSSKYTARVLVVTGNIGHYNTNYKNIDHNRLRKVFELVKYIEKHPFWKAQVEQIHMDYHGDVTLIPKLGDHKIKFGAPEKDIEDKFYRLKVFYKEGLLVEGWEKYKTIDLSFKKQIVAKKR